MKVKHLIDLLFQEDPEAEILTYNPEEGSQPTNNIKVGIQLACVGWEHPCPKCNSDGRKCYKCYQSSAGARIYKDRLFIYGE